MPHGIFSYVCIRRFCQMQKNFRMDWDVSLPMQTVLTGFPGVILSKPQRDKPIKEWECLSCSWFLSRLHCSCAECVHSVNISCLSMLSWLKITLLHYITNSFVMALWSACVYVQCGRRYVLVISVGCTNKNKQKTNDMHEHNAVYALIFRVIKPI